ncbi:imelysin family protein [Pontibacter sp. G13]|uniref:imelysin family protein n=1 Tax=Pontibacter sp. G13 TaxID=3074898 RepID=UPI0028894875|nr:imelysin family protein [Pontibacter sp. G13]WNJ20697.1 imelysin family protein [Pontibacter sp. G13]
MRASFWKTSLFALSMGMFFSCGDDPVDPEDSFDRKAMLEQYADQMIIPAYNALGDVSDDLQAAAQTFSQAPTQSNLDELQTSWKAAALAWESANTYNFGPAQTSFGTLLEEIGTWPVNEIQLESYITDADTLLENFDRDTRGFYAIEYLVFNLADDDAAILAAFDQSSDRGAYLRAVTQHLAEQVDAVQDAWPNYRGTFVDNNGTDAGSSTSALYNEFVKSFEAAKNFKVGLPLGVRPGQTGPEPQLVEAYYSGYSTELLEAHLASIEAIWRGNGNGYRAYLLTVTGGPELVEDTETQLQAIQLSLANLPDGRLADQISTDPTPVNDLHTELQKNTRFFKSDMSSLLGIAITFNSGDGD